MSKPHSRTYLMAWLGSGNRRSPGLLIETLAYSKVGCHAFRIFVASSCTRWRFIAGRVHQAFALVRELWPLHTERPFEHAGGVRHGRRSARTRPLRLSYKPRARVFAHGRIGSWRPQPCRRTVGVMMIRRDAAEAALGL
jgi:hypothetical protein